MVGEQGYYWRPEGVGLGAHVEGLIWYSRMDCQPTVTGDKAYWQIA